MGILGKQSSMGYTRIDEWDHEERMQREAQFLIYKTLKKADQIANQSKSNWLTRLRLSKPKLRLGRRLKWLRRGFVLSLSKAKTRFSKQALCWKFRFAKPLVA